MIYDYKKLRKLVRDVWLAKCISGNIGFNQECYKQIFDFKNIDEYAPTDMKPNDDLDIQLAWLDLLLDKGFDFDSSDLLEKFIDCYKFDFSEYGYAKRNYKRGILPPLSGSYNNYFESCMGCPIRAEIWSVVSCGNMDMALKYTAMDGSIDHGRDSVCAEQWISAVQTLSFTCKDMLKIISDSLCYLRTDSLTYQAVKSVVDAFKAGKPWKETIETLHRTYGCADGTYVVINMAILAAGLLYGGDNYNDVMTLTLNGGYDTDCTCATAGSIFVMVYGIDKIEKKWIDLADKEIVTATENLKYKIDNFDQLADATMKVILYATENGINDKVQITGAEGVERLKPHTTHKIAVFETEYADGVELKTGEKKSAVITVKNIDNVDHEYEISLENPVGLIVDELKQNKLFVKAGESKKFDITCTLNVVDDEMIYENNVINVKLTDGKESAKLRVGFVGCPVFRLSEAYYDGFKMDGKEDIDALPDDLVREWGGKKYLYHTDCNEYTNNWLRYDYEYISEKWTDEYFDKKFESFLPYQATNDFVRIDEKNNMIGPCVVYALQKIVLDEDELLELHLGSSDPYKIWINGELVAEQKENWFFSPYNQRPRYKFKKGVNRIAIKLIRPGIRQKFAYVLRRNPFNHVGAIYAFNKYLVK